MKILITGAAGFVGSHLCERFLYAGHEVIGIDNLITGREENLKEIDFYPKFEFFECNAADIHFLDAQEIFSDVADASRLKGLDGILHLASPASPPKYMEYPLETIEANTTITHRLLELAMRRGARFLFTSTSEIYGEPLVHPQPESYWGNVNCIGPRSVYDESKRMGETLVSLYQRKYGVDTRIVRLFNTYGPRMDPQDGRVVSNFINQAIRNLPITLYGDGSQTRSFCYVTDTVEAIYNAFMDGTPDPMNIGNPVEITVRNLAERIVRLTESKSDIVYKALPQDDPTRRKPNICHAKMLLGWEPLVRLEDGLRDTIRYFKNEL